MGAKITLAAPSPTAATQPRVTLTREEKALLDQALEQCRQAADEIQDHLCALGVWLLQHVFAGDAHAVLTGTSVGLPRVWDELQQRAGGPALRLSARTLSVTVRIAAWDKRLADDHWRLLDVPRKALLLPLADSKLLRDGAKHVTSFRLTQRATTAYVRETLRTASGTEPEARITAGRVAASLRGVRERFDGKVVRRRLREIGRDPATRAALCADIDATIEQLRRAKRDLGSR